MKRKPWPLIVLAILHILSPIGNILANTFLAQVSLSTYLQVLFSPQELIRTSIFLFVPVICGFLIYTCKKWSYYLYLILMLVPFIYSYYSWKKQAMYTPNLGLYLILFYVVNLAIVGYFIIPQVRKVYFDPSLRWWETKPRYTTEFEADVTWMDKTEKAEIKNISEGGIFIKTPLKINTHGRIAVNFKFAEQIFNFSGEVVYINKNSDPCGYGISFSLNDEEKMELKKVIQVLSEKGTLVFSKIPTPEDTFTYWIKKVLTTRKGIVPEVKS